MLLQKLAQLHHGVQLISRVAEQGLEITDKSVDIPEIWKHEFYDDNIMRSR